MKTCQHYKNESSCFTCPYPDCRWQGKIGVRRLTIDEKIQKEEALTLKYELEYIAKKEQGDRTGAKGPYSKMKYHEKRLRELRSEKKRIYGEDE